MYTGSAFSPTRGLSAVSVCSICESLSETGTCSYDAPFTFGSDFPAAFVTRSSGSGSTVLPLRLPQYAGHIMRVGVINADRAASESSSTVVQRCSRPTNTGSTTSGSASSRRSLVLTPSACDLDVCTDFVQYSGHGPEWHAVHESNSKCTAGMPVCFGTGAPSRPSSAGSVGPVAEWHPAHENEAFSDRLWISWASSNSPGRGPGTMRCDVSLRLLLSINLARPPSPMPRTTS